MKAEIRDHFLYMDGKRVPYHDTPNNNDNREIHPRICIMHYTASQSAQSTIDWFMDKRSQVSAHLLICRDGSVHQFVPFNLRAWHCGESSYKGVKDVNTFSVGIEHVNAGLLHKVGEDYYTLDGKEKVVDFKIIDGQAWQTYTEAQMLAGKAIWDALRASYNLTDVVPHSFISPIRKIDTGAAYDWSRIKDNSTTPTDDHKIVRNVLKTLNIRILPEATERAVTVDYPLVKGTQVEEVATNEAKDWSFVKVPTRGISGWVSNQYLSAL